MDANDPTPAPTGWLERLLQGHKRETAEALSMVERGGEPAQRLLAALQPRTGRAQIVGLTGPPGSGKSTLVSGLALHFAGAGRRVGVIAVDPSSPFSGGALLGDRVRMGRASGHARIFIRSASTRGFLGGLSRTTHEMTRVLDAAGYDPILVETVGIGQSEVDIWKVAHTPVVVEAPGSGDAIQAMKAGVLEIAAILCLNKADLPGADAKLLQLKELSRYASAHAEGWELPVIGTIARSGQGIAELAERIVAHREHLGGEGRWQRFERARALAELRAALEAARVDGPLAAAERNGLLAELLDAMVERRIDARRAAAAVSGEAWSDKQVET